METLQTKLSQKRRLNYPMLNPSIFQMGLNSLIKEHHKLQEALEVTCRAVGSLSKNYQNMVSDMLLQKDLFLGTSSYHIIIRARSGITMREMLLDRAQDTIIQIKILQDLERNLLSSIKMPSTCIARYLSVKEQSMHLLWETGLLPPWVRQSVLTKLTSLSNLQLIDLYYFWTLMPSNIQSTWLSNWSLIKRSKLYNCLKVKIVMI